MNAGHTLGQIVLIGVIGLLSSSAFPQTAPADAEDLGERGATWRVANYGLDNASCGSRVAPCRSITQALSLARNGDTLLVGPGRYGNLNGDADFDDPGEERRTPLGISEGCAVCIDKAVSVFSTAGAAVTVIDAANPTQSGFMYVVRIFADGVRFGAKGRGFTITGGQAYGLSAQVADLRVAGNIALNNPQSGLLFFPTGGSIHVADNIATGSAFAGILVQGFGQDRATLVANTAVNNPGSGFSILGDAAHVVDRNVSSSNGFGFLVNGGGMVLTRNSAISNASHGFIVSNLASEPHRFVLNNVIGNRGNGFFFNPDAQPAVLRRNNIFGNLLNNCGIANQSGETIDARNNFWGAATGPGADPADNAGPGSGCDIHGTTKVIPFATQEFAGKPH